MLPTGFIDECKGQGLIAAWFGQAEILKHPAETSFPIAEWKEWKFGLGLKNAEDGNRVKSAEEIRSEVKMLMEGEEGVSSRRAAERFRDAAEQVQLI
ncbi:hypothetical protein SUGI_0373490 [Cryptomeria japonica]|nr:hypothetical protein SUGI_0373490 [Cryptomeria japonica]